MGCGAGVCTLKEEGCRKKGQVHSHDGSGTAISQVASGVKSKPIYGGVSFVRVPLLDDFAGKATGKPAFFWGPPLRQFYMGVSFFRGPPQNGLSVSFGFPFKLSKHGGYPPLPPKTIS